MLPACQGPRPNVHCIGSVFLQNAQGTSVPPVGQVHAARLVGGGRGALDVAGVLQDLGLHRVQLDQRRRVLHALPQHVQRLACAPDPTTMCW